MNKIQRCSSTFSLPQLIKSNNLLSSSKCDLHTSLKLLCRDDRNKQELFKKPLPRHEDFQISDYTAKEKAKSLTFNKSCPTDDLKDHHRFKYPDFPPKLDPQLNENPLKKYAKLVEKIKDELVSNEKLDENAKQLLIRLDILCQEIKELEESCSKEEDQELKNLMKEDLVSLDGKFSGLKDDLVELIYKESYLTDELIMEFENGVGGNEAMMFTKEMVNFYTQFSKRQNWSVNIVDLVPSNDCDGYLNCTLSIFGKDCFRLLRHEAGVHRVQRQPTNDKMNRVHTSTIAIKVIPIFSEVEINLQSKDLEIETMRSTGPGGQLVNKRESAIRILHLPSNIAVKVGEHRSQEENKKIAMEKLRIKLSEVRFKEINEREDKIRSSQVRNLLRSEKIRTFNFQQDRITDHRIKKDMSNLKGFFMGSCDQSLSDWLEEMNRNYNDKLREDVNRKLS